MLERKTAIIRHPGPPSTGRSRGGNGARIGRRRGGFSCPSGRFPFPSGGSSCRSGRAGFGRFALAVSLAITLGACATIAEDEVEVGEAFVEVDPAGAGGSRRATPERDAEAPWREWRGPSRDGVIRGFASKRIAGDRLAGEWRERWRVRIGSGLSGVIADGARVYAHARRDEREIVFALDAETGDELWSFGHPIADWDQPFLAFGITDGPLATPTLAGGRLYTVGIHGRVQALDAETGELIFAVTPESLDGVPSELLYGHATSPLVHDGRLYVALASEPVSPPEGETAPEGDIAPEGHTATAKRGHLLALDAQTGALLWRAVDDPVTYTSPVLATIHGREQLVVRSWQEILGLDPRSGEVLWRHAAEATGLQRDCATPLVVEDVVWITNPFHGTIAIQVHALGSGFEAVRLFRTGALASMTATPIYRDRHLYGLHRRGRIVAIDAYRGERRWSERALDEHASFLDFEGGPVLALGDEGELLAFDPSPEGLGRIATWKLGEYTWAQPGIDARGLYIRDGEELIAFAWPTAGDEEPSASSP